MRIVVVRYCMATTKRGRTCMLMLSCLSRGHIFLLVFVFFIVVSVSPSRPLKVRHVRVHRTPSSFACATNGPDLQLIKPPWMQRVIATLLQRLV